MCDFVFCYVVLDCVADNLQRGFVFRMLYRSL